MEKDPLNLSQYDKARGGTVSTKLLYGLIVGVPLCLIISMIFYFISSLFGASSANSNGGMSYDSKSIASNFNKLQIGLRIMPS